MSDKALDKRTGELVGPPPDYLSPYPIATSAEDISQRSVHRALTAETAEEILADPDTVGLRDLTGKYLNILGVTGIMPSSIGTTGYYLIFEGEETPGKVVTLTTGSPFAMARIAALQQKGFLPRLVRVIQQESASNPGQASLWVVDAEKNRPEWQKDEAF